MPKTIRHQLKAKPFKGNAREAIYNQMKDGNWYTLRELAFLANITEAGASARVRDLRKPKYGGHKVETAPGYSNNPWLYRLVK